MDVLDGDYVDGDTSISGIGGFVIDVHSTPVLPATQIPNSHYH